MKKFTLSVFALLFAFAINAQTSREVLYSDDFEAYTAGDHLAQSIPDHWTTWSNAPGTAEDAIFSAEQAASGSLSVKFSGSDNDNILKLGNKTVGLYEISWKLFVPTGFAGYYNLQHFEAPGNEWAVEVYFDNGGSGYMHAGGQNAKTFSYPYNQWFNIKNVIDLDADWAQIYFDDVLIYEWKFSLQSDGQPGTKQLGSVNFYAGASTGMTPKYYIDDISYATIAESVIFAYDFDAYPTNAYVAQSIPEHFTTWSNKPGTAEDATFSADYALSTPNSVKIAGSTTDLLMKLGNKTSGAYRVSFDYYVPATKAGYFNIQHMEAPGNEWACEIYFDNGGTGYMHAGGQNAATFTYPQGAWFHIDNIIDLDQDWAKFIINDQVIYEWQFSLQAQGQAGTKQLGSTNFYAGASSGMTPTYYFDNVEYVSLVAGAQEPTIGIDPNPIVTVVAPNNAATENLPIENIGGGTLNVNIVRSFNYPDRSTKPLGHAPAGTDGKAIGEFVAAPGTFVSEAPSASREEIILHYDDDAETGIGFNNATKWRAGVRFPASWMAQYNGMFLTQVQIFINEPVLDHKIQVYDMGSINVPGPGELLYEAPIQVLGGWNYININSPVYINGKDLWVAVWMDQPAGAFPMGADAGPAVDDGRWVSSGPGWNFLTLDRNWSIRAVLNGTPSPVWMSVNPSVGSLDAGEVLDVDVMIDASGLVENAEYSGKLHVRSNDFTNELVEIDVQLTVMVGLNDKGEQAYVTMYPNPATNNLNLKANTNIRAITIINNLGQVVASNQYDTREINLNLNQYRSGMYFVRIETANGTTTQKLMVY